MLSAFPTLCFYLTTVYNKSNLCDMVIAVYSLVYDYIIAIEQDTIKEI